MTNSGFARSGRFIMLSRIGILTIGIVAWPSWASAQRYAPSGGGSRKSVSLRGELMVGQGPSTINTMNVRAYSVGLENVLRPSQAPVGGGALSAPMYRAGSSNLQRPVSAGQAMGAAPSSPIGMQSRQVYTPIDPLRFTAGGATMAGGGASIGSLMAPMGEPVPASDPARPGNLPTGRITSLVPEIPWDYKDRMVAGEKAFRDGNYSEAFGHFEKARRISDNCPETLLGLAHASLALAKDSYADTARYLAATIAKFPYLPVVDVNPRDFFGKPADYDEVLARLENAVKTNPKDNSALLVLGYLKMRDNLFPVAVRFLQDAAKANPNKEQAYAIAVLLKSMEEVRQDALQNAPKLAAPVELAWAGLRLALPEGFVLQAVSDPNQFLAATRGGEGTQKPQMINGFAYAVDNDVTPRMTLDQVAAMTSGNPAISNLTQLEEVEVPYLGTTAVARLYGCQFMGEPVIVVRLCVARQMPASGKKDAPEKLMYVLGMGLLESDVEALLPTFSAMARSASLVELRRPVDLLSTANRTEIKLPECGFAIGQPQGWTGCRTPRGYDMAATDFGLSGGTSLKVQAMTTLAPGAFDAKAFGQKVVQDRQREGQRVVVVADSAAQFAGIEGHEFLVRRTVSTAPATRTATRPSASGETAEVLELARLACIRAEDGQTRVFAMIVRGQEADGQALRKVMDSLAGGFRLVKP